MVRGGHHGQSQHVLFNRGALVSRVGERRTGICECSGLRETQSRRLCKSVEDAHPGDPWQGLAVFTALQRRGVPSELLYFPDENHWVLKPANSIQWYDTTIEWLNRWTRQ
jgi:Prolyl oligopeptidase family